MLFLSYLKKIRIPLLAVLVCALIFTAITLLSDLPAAELLYGGILCLVFLLILAIVGFVRFRSRHLLMQKIAENPLLSPEHLPQPHDLAEEDDMRLIESLHREITVLSDRFTAQGREREDYYTAWAHQIKTPIAAMRLLIQSGEIVCPEAEGELFEIEQYVEMALGYLRMESEFTDYRIRSCDLDSILRSVIHDYAGQFIRKKLSLDFRPTGLGLYLCKTILGRLSHTLEVTSTVGVGTKVVIGLDRTEVEVE